MRVNLIGVDAATVYELRLEGEKVAGKLTHPTHADAFLITEPERYGHPELVEGQMLDIVHEKYGVLGTVEYRPDAVVEFDAKRGGTQAQIRALEATL